jgi:hypothetical protein
MAHKSMKLLFVIVAVLCLLALFTHDHLFWIAGVLLALIDLPDFIAPLRSIAASVQKIAGIPPDPDPTEPPEPTTHAATSISDKAPDSETRGQGHA